MANECSRREQILAMLQEDPTDSFLLYGLAMSYVSEGDDAGAVQRFTELLRIKADYIPGFHQGGLALMRLGRAAEARKLLETGVRIALAQGNHHAAEEMQGVLEGIEN